MKIKTEQLEKAYKNQTSNAIVETWSPKIQKITGVTDPAKLEWMSQIAHNAVSQNSTAINEDAFAYPSNAYSQLGGAYQPYNTLYNTPGVGDVVSPGRPALTGADYADPRNNGSGDKFPALLPIAMKVAAKTIGFELVNTVPLQGPSGVLPYMDYVYAGSKQPYGATPAYSPSTANPRANSQTSAPYEFYGLPHAFKASIAPGKYVNSETFQMDGTNEPASRIKRSLKGVTALPAGTRLEAATAVETGHTNPHAWGEHNTPTEPLAVEFIGWSRVDGDPMFKVLSGNASLGSYFNADVQVNGGTLEGTLEFTGKYTPVGQDQEIELTISLCAPRLISMLEDSIQGFTGAGPEDRDAWYGTYQDGTVLYEPMSRGVGEQTPARQISLQLFTKNVQVGTIEVGCGVTQEQVTDLQKQWGIDVIKMVENAAINELSNTINRHITSRLFALGWKNHYKMVEVEGPAANLNISLDPRYLAGTGVRMTPAFAIPQNAINNATGAEYAHSVNVALPYKPLFIPAGTAMFENRDTLIKRIAVNLLAASNWILQRGRYGAATFAVTNITVATALQSNAQYQFSPIANDIPQTGGQLYPFGKMCGMTLYVDPLMSGSDCRVLVGRKGDKSEPGCIFCPYVLAESYRTIASNTMAPKIMVKSRYALVDAGFFPEQQYVTFCVDPHGF